MVFEQGVGAVELVAGGGEILADRADVGAAGDAVLEEPAGEVRWVPRVELGGYSVDQSMRLRIGHYLEGRVTPYLG